MIWAEEEADWPNADHSRFRQHGPHDWHLQELGPRGAPVLVLLHGAGASSHSFAGLIPLLAKRYRVVALDMPGHGFTRRGPVARLRLPHVARDIAALLAAEGITPQVVIGHSAGAAVALEMTRHIDLKGVVALNGALSAFQGIAGWLFPALAKLLALNPFTAFFFARTATPKNVKQMIEATGSTLTDAQLRPYFRLVRDRTHVDGTLSMMAQWDLRPLVQRLPQIDTPVLVLSGQKDAAVSPATGKTAARHLPQADHIVLPKLGHLMHEENPQQVLDRMQPFLDRVLAGVDPKTFAQFA